MDLPIYLSLGAGVQSSTLALMNAKGEIGPPIKAAIFADTQNEPIDVYHWLDWLELQLPFPIYRVTKGNLGKDELIVRKSKKSGKYYRNQLIPAYVQGHGVLPRKCTIDYKINPIRRKLRELEFIHPREKNIRIIQWLGISKDEAHRMKESQKKWIINVYPLVEFSLTRQDCLKWMQDQGYPTPPRSACFFSRKRDR